MKTVVVMPTYNEARNLPELLSRLFSLPTPDLHALIVDDSSPDGTGEVAEELARQYPGRVLVAHRNGKQGLGTAYLEGYRRALDEGADVVVQMDADLSHPPECLPALLEKLQKYDVVIGSRYVPGGGVGESWGLGRRLLSRGGNLYARLVTGMTVRDATSGLRCFRRQVLEQLDTAKLRCKGFGFQVEVAYACWKQGHRIGEVPFIFVDRNQGKSKLSPSIVLEALVRLPQARWGG